MPSTGPKTVAHEFNPPQRAHTAPSSTISNESEKSDVVLQEHVAKYLSRCGFQGVPGGASWPNFEIDIHGHKEVQGHTWYNIQCTVERPGSASADWQTSKRLTHLREGLYEMVKKQLGKGKMDEFFKSTPFAHRGGLPGTTARLTSWFTRLAKIISTGNVPSPIIAEVLQFLDAPEELYPDIQTSTATIDQTHRTARSSFTMGTGSAEQEIREEVMRASASGIGKASSCPAVSPSSTNVAHRKEQSGESSPRGSSRRSRPKTVPVAPPSSLCNDEDDNADPIGWEYDAKKRYSVDMNVESRPSGLSSTKSDEEDSEDDSKSRADSFASACDMPQRSVSTRPCIAFGDGAGKVKDGPANTIQVRGPKFNKDKVKVDSLPAFYELVRVEVLGPPKDGEVHSEVGALGLIDALEPGPSGPLPQFFILNLQLPEGAPPGPFSYAVQRCSSLIMCFRVRPDTQAAAAKPNGGDAALELFKKYCTKGPEDFAVQGKMKFIGRAENLVEVGVPSMFAGYNGKPAIITKSGYLISGKDYLEMDVDIRKFAYLARQGLYQLWGSTPKADVTFAAVIQGDDPKELPERIFACATLNRLDFPQLTGVAG